MPRLAVLLPIAVIGTACDFDHGARGPDAGVDAPPDTIERFADCKAIKASAPDAPTGQYVIDPDGAGSDAELTVTCDMTSVGGGWTVIYFPGTPNVSGAPVSYTRSTPTLMNAATDVLLSYRTAGQSVVGDIASFALPTEWRTATPFSYPSNDVQASVSINGGTAANATVRFGSGSFTNTCDDAWLPNTGMPWGRICITGTKAPYYTGFAVAGSDTCSDSSQPWNAVQCSNDRRFSIAVR